MDQEMVIIDGRRWYELRFFYRGDLFITRHERKVKDYIFEIEDKEEAIIFIYEKDLE